MVTHNMDLVAATDRVVRLVGRARGRRTPTGPLPPLDDLRNRGAVGLPLTA